MARTVAELPKGSRVTDYISLGVVAQSFPLATVKSVLASTGKSSMRQRDLPAHVVVYYVIALALFMQSSSREVLRCLLEERLEERVVSSRNRRNPRGVKRQMSNFLLCGRGSKPVTEGDI